MLGATVLDWKLSNLSHYLFGQTVAPKLGIWFVEVLNKVLIFVLSEPTTLNVTHTQENDSIVCESQEKLCLSAFDVIFSLYKRPEAS